MGRLKLSQASGVEITTVDQDSPAGKAGLREQDVILSFNGQPVSNSRDLRKFIRQTPPGQTVKLGISREGQMQTVPVQLANRKETFDFHFTVPPIPPMNMNIPEPPVINVMQRRSGLTVESLSGQLAQYFGTKSGRGVLVRSVDRGSNAEAAGFKAGDVIIAAGNSSVDNVSDWSRVLRQQNGKVSVKVLRDRREQTLSFNVPDRSRSDASGSFTMPDMGEINKQLAALRPEIERETARAQEEVKREMELHRKDMEEMNSERVKAEMERLKPEIERDIARAQKEAAAGNAAESERPAETDGRDAQAAGEVATGSEGTRRRTVTSSLSCRSPALARCGVFVLSEDVCLTLLIVRPTLFPEIKNESSSPRQWWARTRASCGSCGSRRASRRLYCAPGNGGICRRRGMRSARPEESRLAGAAGQPNSARSDRGRPRAASGAGSGR